MRLHLLTVGNPRQQGLAEAGREYAKRLGRYVKFEESVVKEEKAKNLAPAQVIEKEGERILDRLRPGQFVIALDRSGKAVTSEQLSQKVEEVARTKGEAVFVIGGANGLSKRVVDRANWLWSLSSQTYPHEMARVMVLEQLYRAQTILRGEPYHK